MKKNHRHRRLSLFMVILLAVIGWWLISPRSPRQALRPSQTRRGVEFLQQRTTEHRNVDAVPQPNTPTPTPEQITEVLQIQIAPGPHWALPHPAPNVRIGPAEYWPMLDEAPWPDLASSHSIQDLAEALRNDRESGTLAAFVDDAELDGLLEYNIDEEIQDPWEALVAMQAAHAKAWISSVEEGHDLAVDSLEIADAIIEDWPNNPAADYARLHIIQAITDQWEVDYDSRDAVARFMEIIESTDDMLVLEVAMAEVSDMNVVDWDPALMAEIERLTPDLPPEIQESVAHMAISDAVTHQQWADADRWARRYQELTDLACGPDNPNPRTPASCNVNRRSLAAYEGYRSAELGLNPTDWRSELYAVVHECGLQHLDVQQDQPTTTLSSGSVMQANAEWADGWVWTRWTIRLNAVDTTDRPASADEEIVMCLADYSWEYEPEEPPRLLLVVTLPQ